MNRAFFVDSPPPKACTAPYENRPTTRMHGGVCETPLTGGYRPFSIPVPVGRVSALHARRVPAAWWSAGGSSLCPGQMSLNATTGRCLVRRVPAVWWSAGGSRRCDAMRMGLHVCCMGWGEHCVACTVPRAAETAQVGSKAPPALLTNSRAGGPNSTAFATTPRRASPLPLANSRPQGK